MKPWTITFDGRSWTDEDASTAYAVAVADLIGDSWDAVSPWTGPKSLAAWITVLSATSADDLGRALMAVYAMPVSALGECLAERDAEAAAVASPAFPPPVAA